MAKARATKNKRGGTKGNKNRVKYKKPAERAQMFSNYIAHISQGFSDESFPDCSMKTFKVYRDKFPSEFPTDQIESAQRKRRMFWEQAGMRGTLGIPIEYKDANGMTKTAKAPFNSKSWQFIMMNMFGHKLRMDETSDDKPKTNGPVIYLPQKLPDNYGDLIKKQRKG